MRLDLFLVEHNYYDSRTKAQKAIEAGAVKVSGTVITKSNYEVLSDAPIEIIKETNPYVSRGGLKLEAAIDNFKLDFKNKKVLDIGSSTGGFTDCALKHGAELVYAVDVGTNQLDSSLRGRKDIVLLEQTNILEVESLPVDFDYIVMDVSFVSIEKILPAVDRFLKEDTTFICLIKPQFEVGKRYMKNGIVKDRGLHIKVLEHVISLLGEYHLGVSKLIPSPILGGSGNKEFLACIKRGIDTRINVIEVCK
ncbi:MAG: TlyA family RNA methyltransferase [Anaeroplasmataceae bacterium]|nr:TlyA family RNA methyltransferase [Anaeroplasmataceae bacterium]MDE7385321.1 TlyA family RNA methyltransferase [Anaeroplasmataceae bacterium]